MSILKNFICIIPARAGSKGVKNKNLVKIKNKPLIQYTIDVAKKLSKHCEIVVSTDSLKIKKICIKNKLDFYGLRPKRLSNDTALTRDVVMYEVKRIEKILNKKFFGILLLQPTCPIRDFKKLMKSMRILKNEKFPYKEPVDSAHPLKEAITILQNEKKDLKEKASNSNMQYIVELRAKESYEKMHDILKEQIATYEKLLDQKDKSLKDKDKIIELLENNSK